MYVYMWACSVKTYAGMWGNHHNLSSVTYTTSLARWSGRQTLRRGSVFVSGGECGSCRDGGSSGKTLHPPRWGCPSRGRDPAAAGCPAQPTRNWRKGKDNGPYQCYYFHTAKEAGKSQDIIETQSPPEDVHFAGVQSNLVFIFGWGGVLLLPSWKNLSLEGLVLPITKQGQVWERINCLTKESAWVRRVCSGHHRLLYLINFYASQPQK